MLHLLIESKNQRNKNLHIKGNKLYLLDKGPKNNLNLPIDIFFHTLGEEYKEKSIGIILSGTGSDGSRGINTIKEGGGTILVQEPSTAQFDGMPNSSIATNLVDYILDPEKIALILSKFPFPKLSLSLDNPEYFLNDSTFQSILEELHKSTDIDFKDYKYNTLLRRLEKRMTLNNIEFLEDYSVFLMKNPGELITLKQDFLIGVTSFFRDTEAFANLKDVVIPDLFERLGNNDTLRVWVLACSSGHEAYSVAMLLDEYIRNNQLKKDFKIFATDVDVNAIARASAGIFNSNIVSEMDNHYFEDYFIKTGDKVHISKRIREKIVFSVHNVLKDPPFIRLDLITCRNMLIYLENKVQKKIMHNFHFSLNKYGYLFLGSSESLGEIAKHFKTIETKWKMFQSISDSKSRSIPANLENNIRNIAYTKPSKPSGLTVASNYVNEEDVFHKYLSTTFAPDCIFIDSEYNVIFIKGDAGNRLTIKQGVFQSNLLKMIEPEIAVVIRNGINRLVKENKTIQIKNVFNNNEGKPFTFDLTFSKSIHTQNFPNIFLIQFSEDKIVDEDYIKIENVPFDEISTQRLIDLEEDLRINKTELQNVVEELETSNEELQSSNEELMASNEELQSTNEELQSVNEELYTVNSELQQKNKELELLYNDMNNLLNSTDIGTLFLDRELRIRKFTPALNKHFNLQDTDLNRLISSFTSNFDEVTRKNIIGNSKKVLSELITIENEVQDFEGNIYLERISPFVTVDKKIDGVVITFIDITTLKNFEKEIVDTKELYELAAEATGIALWDWNLEEDISIGNSKWHDLFCFGKNQQVNGDWIREIFIENADKKNNLIDTYFNGKNDKFTFEHKFYNPKLKKDIWIETTAKIIERRILDKPKRITGVSQDITERKMAEFNLLQYRQAMDSSTEAISMNNSKGEFIYINKAFTALFGFTLKDLKSVQIRKKLYEDPKFLETIYTELFKGNSMNIELKMHNKVGGTIDVNLTADVIKDANETIVGYVNIFSDITEMKAAQQGLIEAKFRAEEANNHKNVFLANMSHELRTPMNGVIGFANLLNDSDLSESNKSKYISIINNSSKQLLTLIDDILDISKIEADEFNIVKNVFKPSELIEELLVVFNQFKINHSKTGVNFKAKVPKAVKDILILSDRNRLSQVLTNLLSNALKFTHEGTIEFGYTVSKARVNFYVNDSGIGIPEDKQSEIFERFKQVKFKKSELYGGTGLGLAICRGIVEILGGEIQVKSKVNIGSQFSFYIPLELIEGVSLKPEVIEVVPKSFDFKDKCVLIVEDNSIIKKYLQTILLKNEFKLFTANNGLEAVNIYKESGSEINLVLMDLGMPIMDGYVAAEEILKLNPAAIILAQTAYVGKEEQEKCYKIGFKGFVPKPVDRETLLKELNHYL